MPARIDLSYDAARGPGHALCRITGLDAGPAADGLLEIRIQRNQDGSYLRPGRTWGASEVWIPIGPARAEGTALTLTLGPDIVDELATAPASVRFLCHLRVAGRLEAAALGGTRMLRPSGADGAGPARETVAAPAPIREPVAEPPEPAPVEPPPPVGEPPDHPDPPPEKKRPAIPVWIWPVAAVLVLLAAGGALWQLGLPPFPTPEAPTGMEAAAPDAAEPETAVSETAAPETAAPAAPAAIETLQDVHLFVQGAPSADEALAEARSLLERDKKDLSLLLFQHAARQGSREAGVAVARFYDPATWTAETSPLPQADAETAAYWYEPAAQNGDVEAQRRLGQILIELDLSAQQRAKGVEWLRKAADAGDAEAKTLLEALQ